MAIIHSIIMGSLLVSIFLSIVALAYFSSISALLPKRDCRTKNCQEYANELRNDMNTKINPCDNFYEYVCGNWNKNHPIPTDRRFQDQYTIILERTRVRLREIAESNGTDDKNPFVKKARKLYKACMDINTIKKNSIGEIMNYVKETGGWPIIMKPSEWEKNNKTWQTVDSEYNVITGTSLFFDFAVVHGSIRPYKNNLVIRPPSSPSDSSSNVPIMKNDDDLFRDPAVVENMNLIKNIANVMARVGGFVFNERQVEKDAQGIVRFLHYLEYIAGFVGSKSVNVTTIEDFQAFCESAFPSIPPTGRIDWLQRIRQVFPRHSSVDDSLKWIIVRHAGYFKGLFSILRKISERDIVNTIQWWFVEQTLMYTMPEILGLRDPRPRWKKCIEENELQYVLAYVQIEKKDLEKTKAKVVDMIEKVKVAMKEKIRGSKWLSDKSKNSAIKKIDGMVILVGYPDWYKDPTILGKKLYNNLLIDSSYLKNFLLLKQFQLEQKLELVGKILDIGSFIPNMIKVNAHQNHANIITFPIGILQKPKFNGDYPDAINYGGIGATISHEISHGFDSNGIFFDKDGKRGDWWSSNDILEYKKRCQGFIDQFNKEGVPGERTVNENIADSTGLRAAFKAYKKHTGLFQYRNTKLPGLEDLSPDKLFFVSFAWSYCSSVKPELARILLNKSVHSPSPQRVNGAVSNSKDFSKAFECKKNSPMNPSVKCTIW